MVKKYISADLRVINIYANDIIATSNGISLSSAEDTSDSNAWNSMDAQGRHVWDEF